MINPEASKKIIELCSLYEKNWGCKVYFGILPPYITQEKMLVVLERIVDAGESILVGYNKCFSTSK